MNALQFKSKTMATIKQHTIHHTMQTIQTKLKNTIHRNQSIKKHEQEPALQALQTKLKPIHPDNH